MKFELTDRLMSRFIGIGVAAAVTVSWTIASQILSIKEKSASITTSRSAVPHSAGSDSETTVVIPFNDNNGDGLQDDSGKLYEVYTRIVKDEKEKKRRYSEKNTVPSVTQTTIASETTTTTTQATTASTEAVGETTPTEAGEEQLVSNGKQPFNYNDVSSIAANMNTLGDFVEQLHPTAFSWDTSNYPERGYVEITLASPNGSVSLEVKPAEQSGEIIEPYTIGSEVNGSVNISALADLDWYQQNKKSGGCIRSVTWLRSEFALTPVRGIGLGTGLAELTDHYLCVNGGATTLYKASDVIGDTEKLNALIASENAYTFVGGRLYTINGYLDKYYSGRASSYQFEDCDMVVQYGCNSIVDHNYTTGSWIIEYAIKDDAVVGITFLNKSYYKKSEIHGGATSSSTSSTSISPGVADTTTVATTETVSTTAPSAETAESSGSTEVIQTTEGTESAATSETLSESIIP